MSRPAMAVRDPRLPVWLDVWVAVCGTPLPRWPGEALDGGFERFGEVPVGSAGVVRLLHPQGRVPFELRPKTATNGWLRAACDLGREAVYRSVVFDAASDDGVVERLVVGSVRFGLLHLNDLADLSAAERVALRLRRRLNPESVVSYRPVLEATAQPDAGRCLARVFLRPCVVVNR